MPVLFPEISAELGLSIVEVGWFWDASSFYGDSDRLDQRGARGSLWDAPYADHLLLGWFAGCIARVLVRFYHAGAYLVFIWSDSTFSANECPQSLCNLVSRQAFHGQRHWFDGDGIWVHGGICAECHNPFTTSRWVANVLFLYGAISAIIGILWYFTQTSPNGVNLRDKSGKQTSMKEAVAHIVGLRSIWFVALAGMGFNAACVQGTLGYLPTYLTQIGWSDVAAGM